MSTTLDGSVAEFYAKANPKGPSTVIKAQMSAHFKGAVVNWYAPAVLHAFVLLVVMRS